MTRSQISDEINRNPIIPTESYNPLNHHRRRRRRTLSLKLSVFLLATSATLFLLFQIPSLLTPPPSPSSQPPFLHQPRRRNATTTDDFIAATTAKLRRAVTFLPLKDLRFVQSAQKGHTWFMSSTHDTHEDGEVQFQHFPSHASNGRLLCLKGRDTHDGAWNSYAVAWPETLPYNATLMKGLTFVSYNHYDYDNIWHGLSAMVPFVAWHIKNGCSNSKVPTRWVLFHWGELRTKMGPWLSSRIDELLDPYCLSSLMEATFGGPLGIEAFGHDELGGDGGRGGGEEIPACFEEAVVMRHNEGGMSRRRRMEVYDLMRCKARVYCNVSLEGRVVVVDDGGQGSPVIGMTMLMRTGPRSFRNQSAVVGIFERECGKVEGCQFMVAQSNNLTFCEQVKLMMETDILISPHGAQLTNMFLMDKNNSVMEFFPKGWLSLAGIGQYVYHWIASWSGMRHQGAWRDPDGDPCPYRDDDPRCMSVYKGSKIGYNETFFAHWAKKVLNEVKMRKMEEASKSGGKSIAASTPAIGCACS